ncbi:MAG: ComEC/Rec2 family competence protein [Rikenellaceae bacterium]
MWWLGVKDLWGRFLGVNPFLFVTFPFVLGILISCEVDSLGVWFWALGLIFFGVTFLFRLVIYLLVFGFFALGYFLGLTSQPTRECPLEYRTNYIATIETTPLQKGRYNQAQARILAYRDTVTGEWCRPREACCLINVDTTLGVQISDVVLYRSTIYPFEEPYSSYYLNQHIEGRSYIYALERLDRSETFMHKIERRRRELSARLEEISASDSNAVAMIQTLTLGVRDNLSGQTRSDYRTSGAAHLLAISGLHVGIIFALLNLIFYWTRYWERLRWLRSVVVVLALWGYALLCGGSASVLRAVTMFTIVEFGLLFSSRRSLFNTLLIAAFLMLLYNPRYLFDVGFRLSYLAMVGIALIYIPLRSRLAIKNRILKRVVDVILISLSAQLLTAPLVLYTFGEISIVSPLTNILVWLTVPLIILGGMLYLLCGSTIIATATLGVTQLQNSITHTIGTLEGVTYRQGELCVMELAIYYLIILLIIIGVNLKTQKPQDTFSLTRK